MRQRHVDRSDNRRGGQDRTAGRRASRSCPPRRLSERSTCLCRIYRRKSIVADLKLGRLPKQGTVRITIVLPEPLKEELDRYAAEHSKLYEPVETATLIPHMLEAFIRTDRGWRSRRKRTEQVQSGQRRASP